MVKASSGKILKMSSREFIALSACTMMLTALGIDIMLPVFGELRVHFGLPRESTATAQIIGFFFMGQVAQFFFGILSDRYGRLPILRVGFPLYIVGGVAAAYSPTLEFMYASRFVAGMGASAVFMTTIATVRDRFVGDHMARIMSLVFTIFLFTPVVAPFIGLAILNVSSWQMVFLAPPLFAVFVFLWSLRLEESHPEEKRTRINRENIKRSIKKVLGNATFLRYNGITTILFAVLSSYVASSEHMVGEIYHRPDLFSWIFASIGLLMAIFTLVNSRLSIRFGARRTLRTLIVIYTVVASALLIGTLMLGDPPPMAFLFILIALLMSLTLAIEPNSSALGMEPMGDNAGIASALYGTCSFFIGSTLGSFISYLMAHGVLPLVVSYFIVGVLGVLLAFSDRREFK